MPIDTDQLQTDVEFLTSQEGWKQPEQRRDWLRNTAVQTKAKAEDPEYHSALMQEMWSRVDDRGILQKGAEFTGKALGEVVKSMPATGGAAVFGAADLAGITDTGSGVRLKTGVTNLLDSTRQRIKSWVPGDAQEARDKALEALKFEIDSGSLPDGVERWAAGDDSMANDPEVKPWIDALTTGLARRAVEADSGFGADIDQRVQQWLASDRNPAAMTSGDRTEGPRQFFADYLATRDPQSWEMFQNRLRETDTQHRNRAERFVAESANRDVMAQMPEGLAKEMITRSQDMQTSPIDLATTVLPMLRGAKALEAARKGESALAGVLKGSASEAVPSGATTYFGDARASNAQVLEDAAMGAVGSGVLEGGMGVAGRLMRPGQPGQATAQTGEQGPNPTAPNQSTVKIGDVTYAYNRRELTPDQIKALHDTGGIQEFVDAGAITIAAQPVPAIDAMAGLNDPGTPEGDVTRLLDLQSRQGQWQRQTTPVPAMQETAPSPQETAQTTQPTATAPVQQHSAPLIDPTGADLITALTDNQLRLEQPTDQAEWDWYREIERAAQSSSLTKSQAAAAARRGDLTDAKAQLAWINNNVLAGPGRGVSIDQAAATLQTDPRQQFAVDGTTIGGAILDTIRQRQQAQQGNAQMQQGEANAMAQAQAWETDQAQRFNRQGDARRSVPTDRLGVGDRLRIGEQSVRVAEVAFDPNDNLESVTLDGGPAFGRVNIDVATMQRVLAEDYQPADRTGGEVFSDPLFIASAADAIVTLAKGAKDLAQFTGRLVQQFGDWITPHAQALWDAVKRGEAAVKAALEAIAGNLRNHLAQKRRGSLDIGSQNANTAGMASTPGAAQTPAPSPGGLSEADAVNPMTIYRAGDADEVGVKPWASFTPERDTAEAYTDNPGFGGDTIRELRIDAGNILDLTKGNKFQKLAEAIGFEGDEAVEKADDWHTSGWNYPWEESGKVKSALAESEFDAVKYTDDFPAGATTIIFTREPRSINPESTRAGNGAGGFTVPGLNPNARTGGFVNGEILAEALALAERGINEFGAWSAAMLRKFGESVRSLLQTIWQNLQNHLAQKRSGAVINPNGTRMGSSPITAELATEQQIADGEARTSQFGQRVQADARLTPDVRANAATQFAIQPQQQAADTAAAIIRSEGLDGAVAQFRGEGLPMPVRIAGLTQAVLQYDARASLARRSGNEASVAAYDSLVDQAIEAKASLEFLGNEAGRNLAMFNAYQRMSPDGMIRRVKRQLTKAVNDRADAEIGAQAAEVATVHNEEQATAEAELLEEILAQITEEATEPTTVRNRTTETPRSSILGRVMDWTAGLLEDLAESPILESTIKAVDDALKALSGKLFADPLLITPLGQAALKALKTTLVQGQKLATAIASAIRIARSQVNDPSISDKKLAKSLIRAVSKELLKPVVQRVLKDAAYTASPQLETDLQAAGLSARRAKTMAAKLRQNRGAMLAKLQAAVRKRVLARLTPRKAQAKHKLPKILDIAEKAVAGGVWTEQAVQDAYTDYFKLPKLTAEQQQRIADLAAEVMALPEGVLRRTKSVQLLNELAMIKGVPASDVLMAAWYANILSGLSTQGVNVWGNGLQLALRTMALSLASPRDFGRLLKGIAAGWGPGLSAARTALRTGMQERVLDMNTAQQQSALEILAGNGGPQTLGQWLGWIASAGGLTRYVLRALGAVDAVFFHTAKEGMAHLATARALRAGRLKPGTVAFRQEFIRQLGGDEAQAAADLAQARQELLDAGQSADVNLINRRAYELRVQRRGEQTNRASVRFGERATFTQNPEGIGAWISAMITLIQKFPVVGRLLVPFNRMVSNLFEGALDWTPVGIMRGLIGRHLTDRKATFDVLEARERLWAGIFGTVVMGSVWAAAMARKDESDEDVDFMIYGMGPRDPNRRAQMPKGWRPYSIKVGGQYISFAESPLGMALAGVAGWVDAERYGSSSKTGAERLQLLMQNSLGSFSRQGVLSSMADTMDLLTGDISAKKLYGTSLRSVTGLIPGQGLLRDASTLFDDRKISDDSVYAALAKDVPYFRGLGTRPALNAFGEPVKMEGLPIVRRFVTGQRTDVDADWLGRNRLVIPGLPEVIEVGDYLLPQTVGGVSLDESTKRRALGLTALAEMVMTTEQRFTFAKRAGELTKEGIQRLRKSREEEPVTQDPYKIAKLQEAVQSIATAARMVAMNEAVARLR